MKKIKLFECYAGYGGASFALQFANIDYECVGYSEISKKQIRIYEQNHKGVKNYGDITLLNPNELPDFDLITGGFPCQDVSIAGLRDLSQGRTNTVFKMLEIIKVKKPKYCLLKNVEGILSMHNGELINQIVRTLKSYGYAVSYQLLKSKDYGTPQNRPRVWIACELGRSHFMFNPFPPKEELKLFVSDLLEKDVDSSYYLNKKQIERVIRRSEIRGKLLGIRINPKVSMTITTHTPLSTPADSIFIHSNVANTITSGDYSHCNVHNQFLVEEMRGGLQNNATITDGSYSPTLTSTMGMGGGNIPIINSLRVLTPKECFRLMGFFNDEINLDGIPKTNAYFSVGNGWDVNLVSKIFKHWLKK